MLSAHSFSLQVNPKKINRNIVYNIFRNTIHMILQHQILRSLLIRVTTLHLIEGKPSRLSPAG